MQTAGGGFAAAVTSHDQLVDYKVTVGFPSSVPSYKCDLTKCVVSIDIDRAVVTTLPDGTTLISGYPSAAMTVQLSGMLNQAPGVALVEADSVYRLFNPNDSSSLTWRTTTAGLSITAQAGLWDGATAADLVTQFTGTIDQVTCSNGVVTLVCRDQRSTVTNQATLPPVITNSPYNAGLTSEYAIDYLLRHSSPAQYLSRPAQRANCVLSVGFRASLWPEVGSYAAYAQVPSFGTGVYGSALTNTPFLNAYTVASPVMPSQTFFIEGWVTGGGAGNFSWVINDAAATYQVVVEWLSDGSLYIFAITPSGTSGASHVVLGTTGEHYVGLKFTWAASSTTISGNIRVDATDHAITVTALNARPSNLNLSVVAIGAGTGTIEAVQVSTETSPAYNNTFTPTLILDPSLNSLTALPDVSGQDSWSVLQDIAAAESAVIGFDELGVCRFVNRQTIRTMSAVASLTSSTSLLTLDSLQQMSLCATHIQVPVNQLSIGAVQKVWGMSTVTFAPAFNTLVFTATTDTEVLNIQPDSGFLNSGDTSTGTCWRGSVNADGTGNPVTGGIGISVVQLSANQLQISVINTNPFIVYFVQPAVYGDTNVPTGTPFFQIGGQPVAAASGLVADVQWPPAASGGAVSNPTFGEVLLQVQQDGWIQDYTSAQLLANDLLKDLHYPKPLVRNLGVVADPRRQLLDRVTLIDPDVSQFNDDVQLIGIHTQLSSGQWSQMIDARPMAPPGAWILGKVGRSELGLTTYLY